MDQELKQIEGTESRNLVERIGLSAIVTAITRRLSFPVIGPGRPSIEIENSLNSYCTIISRTTSSRIIWHVILIGASLLGGTGLERVYAQACSKANNNGVSQGETTRLGSCPSNVCWVTNCNGYCIRNPLLAPGRYGPPVQYGLNDGNQYIDSCEGYFDCGFDSVCTSQC